MAESTSSAGADSKVQPTASVQPVCTGEITPASPTTPQNPDAIRPVKHRPFSNVTNVSYDPTSPQPQSPSSPNFISRFWAQRGPASKHITNTIDEKNGRLLILRTWDQADEDSYLRNRYTRRCLRAGGS